MPITYRSTRGRESVSFAEALLRGLAPDGGLYVPDAIPRMPLEEACAAGTFDELGFRVLETWLGEEIEDETLRCITQEALNLPVPIVPLEGVWKGIRVMELFHGPTLSFKDFGARTMARCMKHILETRGERVTILVATSGDTGSAVADGFAGQDRIEVVLLYPKGKVSPVQERQLIAERPGVCALAVAGDFDDCQRMVKAAFVDPALAGVPLSSANSINIGRLLPQMLYYVWAVRSLRPAPVRFCVPSGNLGNLTAGILAHLSGMPVSGFLAAHNANDFFPRVLWGGDAAFAPTVRTISNAMDVGAPSNFERLATLLDPGRMRTLIRAERVSDEETIASIRRVYDETGYVADPHTAVGLEAVRRGGGGAAPHAPTVVLATAHPAKFPETVAGALGFAPKEPDRLAALLDGPVAVEDVSPTLEALRERLRA
jgi:threonine synthase